MTQYTERQLSAIHTHLNDINTVMKTYDSNFAITTENEFAATMRSVAFWLLSWRFNGRDINAEYDLCYVALISDMLQCLSENSALIYDIKNKTGLRGEFEHRVNDLISRILGVWNTPYTKNNVWSYSEDFHSNLDFLKFYCPNALEIFFHIMGEIAQYKY